MKMVKMVKMVKIVKMTWSVDVGVFTTSGNSEYSENGENSENDMGYWGGGVYHLWK